LKIRPGAFCQAIAPGETLPPAAPYPLSQVCIVVDGEAPASKAPRERCAREHAENALAALARQAIDDQQLHCVLSQCVRNPGLPTIRLSWRTN
jgi:hypothetical protein